GATLSASPSVYGAFPRLSPRGHVTRHRFTLIETFQRICLCFNFLFLFLCFKVLSLFLLSASQFRVFSCFPFLIAPAVLVTISRFRQITRVMQRCCINEWSGSLSSGLNLCLLPRVEKSGLVQTPFWTPTETPFPASSLDPRNLEPDHSLAGPSRGYFSESHTGYQRRESRVTSKLVESRLYVRPDEPARPFLIRSFQPYERFFLVPHTHLYQRHPVGWNILLLRPFQQQITNLLCFTLL